ncbi:MAG: hypothetical protein FWE13_02135 [Firmicutes bacterium]|nr:hypothetical protein [Bacillota bacterium]
MVGGYCVWAKEFSKYLHNEFDALGPHDPANAGAKIYETLSNEFNIADGFRQTTKGRCSGNIKINQNLDKILIDPSNAFSFNLPVISRTLVNQVVVEYYVLEPQEENFETVTVNRRNCRFELDEKGNEAKTFIATLKLEKIYNRIGRVTIDTEINSRNPVSIIKLLSVTANSLEIKFEDEYDNWDEIEIRIN